MFTLTGQLEKATTNPDPVIEYHLPERETANGAAIVIFPGGGYVHLAEHEGKGYAEFFVQHGYACFVVQYRRAGEDHRHPDMIEDAYAAIETVRKRSQEFGVDPGRLGVMGSSAGGHLAAHSMVASHRYTSSVSLRPDFGILCYPVITMTGEFCHKGSRANLLGPEPSESVMEEVSCEKHVTPETPPCFLWHTEDDPVVLVENSLLFASALRRNKVSFELHIYNHGRHGLGLNAPFTWQNDCLRWLKDVTDQDKG